MAKSFLNFFSLKNLSSLSPTSMEGKVMSGFHKAHSAWRLGLIGVHLEIR